MARQNNPNFGLMMVPPIEQPQQQPQGDSNLLDVLGTIGSGALKGLGAIGQGAQYFAAGLQAGRGNTGPMQLLMQQEMMQKQQEQQKRLIDQLGQMSQQEMSGPFGEVLKRQAQFGDVAGMQKTLTNIPRYKQVQALVRDQQLGLPESERAAIESIAAVDPQMGLELIKRYTGEKAVTSRQENILKETFKQRRAMEDLKTKRQESKLPGNIVATAIENGDVDPKDIQGIIGVLQGANVKLPENENDARIYVSRILNSPRVKKLIPQEQTKTFKESFLDFFRSKSATQPAQTPVQQPQQQPQFNLPPGFKIEQVK